MNANAQSNQWFGTNRVGHKQLKWNSDEDKMNEIMAQYGRKVQFSIHELYSPPRVNNIASRLRQIPGMSFDITINDPDDGQPWDFNNPEKADKARRIIENKRAVLLIGSPMCTAFSSWQHINFAN